MIAQVHDNYSQNAPESQRDRITAAFIQELERFRDGGYKFNNGSNRELFPGTQREAFDAYLDGGSFDFRVSKLCELIASNQLTPEQKQESCDIINAALKIEPRKRLSPEKFEDSKAVAITLGKAIGTKYGSVRPKTIHQFLAAIQKDTAGLSEDNPLKTYKSLDGVKGGYTEGYMEIPTGVGKTPLFLAIISCYLKATENMPDAPGVLIHEPTNDLVGQTALEFADFLPHLAKTIEGKDNAGRRMDFDSGVLEVHNGRRKGARNEHRVLITTYQSQAAEEWKVAVADSFKGQVAKLCRFVASKHLTGEQKIEACNAINTALGGEITGITPESIKRVAKDLAAIIEDRYSNAPDLKDFLQAVQRDARVSRTNPIKSYRTNIRQDKQAAIEGRNIKAEDFHLVIHDEAHYVNGTKYGMAAVDKFRGAIQLGVTATPEYSTSRTVANKLANRYYNLPLNKAIERRDLCYARPILIKTILTEPEKQRLLRTARAFLEEQHGQPFTDRQLEKLYNQAARNKAILKAYLTGTHPDTGEPFLGDLGLIYLGGIKHCNDFIECSRTMLNTEKFKPVKDWLRDEGLALVAPIHSEVPKEGVDIMLGGKKTRCTKEQIKELHRQGRILLLASDQELKLGSNFPRDKFVVDGVDRFTIPDAVQRMGRGLRLDLPNLRYPGSGDKAKSCVLLNAIDATTHEIYEGTPHHPIHAIEILQGAVHRPTIPRIASTRFKNQPPRITGSLEELGFEFIHRIDDIQREAKKFKEGKKKPLPEKDKHWLSAADTGDLPGGGRGPILKAVKELTSESSPYDSARLGIQTINYKGQSIDLQKMQAAGTQPICIRRKHWGRVEKAAGVEPGAILPDKDEYWLSSKNTEDSDIVSGGTRRAIRRAVKELTGESTPYDSKKLGIQTVKYKGQSIDLQKMQAGTTQPICIRREHWARVEKAAGVEPGIVLPDKDEHWLSSTDTRDSDIVSGGGRGPILKAVKELTGESSPYDSARLGIQTINYKGQSIDLQKMQSGHLQPICIRRTHWGRVEKAAEVESLHADESLKSKPYSKKDTGTGGEHLDRKDRSGRG